MHEWQKQNKETSKFGIPLTYMANIGEKNQETYALLNRIGYS